MSQTGANADEWVPVTPGTEGVLALGMAHVIMAAKLRPAAPPGSAGAAHRRLERGACRPTRPIEVEKMHRRGGQTRSSVSRASSPSRRPAVAMIGGAAAGSHQRPVQRARRSMRSTRWWAASSSRAACSSRRSSTSTPPPSRPPAARRRDPRAPGGRHSGRRRRCPQVLLIDGANPVFTAPQAWRVREALEQGSVHRRASAASSTRRARSRI